MYRNLNFPSVEEIPDKLKIDEELIQKTYLLNGCLTEHAGRMQECFSPIYIRQNEGFVQKKLGEIPMFTPNQSIEVLNDTVKSYRNGSGEWQKFSFEDRISTIEKFLDLIIPKREMIVKYLIWETGKNIAESESEFDRTIEYTRHSIETLRKINRKKNIKIQNSGFEGIVRLTPSGVVLSLGPSNYPFYETYSIVLPALLMGNNVILKIPRNGALLHSFLFDAVLECFPAGVLNILYGTIEESVLPVMEQGKVDVFAYFGGSETAKQIIKAHPAPHRLKLALGTEAKNPAIVLKDANPESCVKEILLGALAFNGQRCAALKMIFVHTNIYSTFMRKVHELIENASIGMPWLDKVRITPLSEEHRIQYLNDLLEDALSKGALIENKDGGESLETLFIPAILTNVSKIMRIWEEEQFGPIVPIAQYDDIEEVINYIETQRFGQQLSIFGNDKAEIEALCERVENQVSRININCKCQRGPDVFPFSGKKDSGLGVLSIEDTLLMFSSSTVIAGKSGSSIIL